uniref:UDP-glucuronosyltransferase n=1 Tax=Chilo suppressalis TaxID=168631 RepID=A0A481XWQ3_CHISP|nr:UDP-glycosyltransferase UGT42H1 [Chilo suppressalis]
MRHMTFLCVCVLVTILTCSSSALKILSVFPYPGKSHFIVVRVLLRELARKGHDVTVISYYPEKNPPQNYHDIVLSGESIAAEDSLSIEDFNYMSVIQTSFYLTLTGKENCEILLSNKEVQDLVKRKTKFDVVLVEQFNSDCALGLAYKLNAPVVGVTTHIMMPWHYNRYGISYNPSYVSFHFLKGGTKPTLYQRLERVVFDAYFKILYYVITQRSNQNVLAKYYNDIPPLEDLAREIKCLLISQHFTLTSSGLYPANVIEVGGYHVEKARPLNGDLGKFVEEADAGVIYISFGSTFMISTMPQDKLEAILETIAELPQRFVWRWNSVAIDKPPFTELRSELRSILTNKRKVYLSAWLPQVDLLGHPKTVAFFSHAGMGGTTESLHFGVPVVAMPILGDQLANGASIEESGLGVQIFLNDLTKENLIHAIKNVMEPGFRERVRQLSKAWHDRPLSPLDTAVYWTEYTARNANFTFRSAAADVPLYQFYNLDVAFIFVIIFVILIATCKILLCRPKKQATTKKKRS